MSLCIYLILGFAIVALGSYFRADEFKNSNKELQKENSFLKQTITQANESVLKFKAENNTLSNRIKEKQQEIAILENRIEVARKSPEIRPILSYQEALKIAHVPTGVSFDKENLPHYYSNSTVESNMHVYISSTGNKYHRIKGCSRATIPIHLFIAASSFTPCERCIPYRALSYTIPNWYFRYLQLICQCKIITVHTNQLKYDVRYQLEEPAITDDNSITSLLDD
jgi:hypothetical protein